MKLVLIENPENGLALCGDIDREMLLVYSNGSYYDVDNCRPISGDGRQLRENSRDWVRANREKAWEALAAEVEAQNNRIQTACAKAVEAAQVAPAEPRKNFADALQDAFLQTLTEKAAGDLTAQIYPAVEKMVIEKFGAVPKAVTISVPNRPTYTTTEVLHKDFDRIVSMVLDGEPVYLCGAAGTGKSYLVQQVAKALNLEYYYTNSVTDDVQLKGFIDANGRYHETQFYKAFTQGGVFLLDELDASVPEALVLLNNALANGYFSFPNGKAQAHPDFRCLAAGNTVGTGADDVYTGRFSLDASSLDRFAFVFVDYDRDIELNLCSGNIELVVFAHDFRAACAAAGVTCLCTYRAIKRLNKFTSYMTKAEALKMGLVKGLNADDVRAILGKMVTSSGNPWMDALREVVE